MAVVRGALQFFYQVDGKNVVDLVDPHSHTLGDVPGKSEEAQDDGAFVDEDGDRAWLATNHGAIMTETTRRMQKAQAASEKKKAAMALVLKARQEEQKAAAWAAKAAKREAAEDAALTANPVE